MKKFSLKNVEFTVRGYVHIDYMTLTLDEQYRHFSKAIDVFSDYSIPFLGFRAPFLRINGHSHEALNSLKFGYDSSLSVNWNVINLNDFSKQPTEDYHRLMDFYRPLNPEECLVLPR